MICFRFELNRFQINLKEKPEAIYEKSDTSCRYGVKHYIINQSVILFRNKIIYKIRDAETALKPDISMLIV